MKREKTFQEIKEKAINEAVERYAGSGSSEEKVAFAELLEGVLDSIMLSERDIFLSGTQDNKGNGFYSRTLSTGLGKLGVNVPRDRNNKFRSNILPGPWVRSTDSYESLLTSLVINGYSKSNIVNTLKQMNLPYSDAEILKIEEDILRRLEEFKSRELPENAFALYIDAYHTQVREKSGKIKKCCIYSVLGIDLDGNREIYGFYVLFGSENKGEWIKIFNDLISRGLKRLLLIISDDFPGLDEAISIIFEKTDHQLCFIHLQRNTRRNMSKTDSKEFNTKLRQIYIYSKDFDEANAALLELLNEYKPKYPAFISYISKKQEKYLSFMKYPSEIRRNIYTTNIMESFNALLEKIRIRLGGYFASQEILGINVLLQCEKLSRERWCTPHPYIKSAIYEINQLFKLRFYEQK